MNSYSAGNPLPIARRVSSTSGRGQVILAKVVDRLLLFLNSIVIIVISCILILVSIHWIMYSETSRFVTSIYENTEAATAVIIIAVIFILINLRFFYIAVRRSSSNAPSIDQRTEFGNIQISIDTVQNLSLKAASRIRGVKDLKSKVRVNADGLEITIRSIIDGESSIPALTEEMQRAVKEHVEEITGIPVATVSVYVANVIQAHSYKSRVE
jgi:uncharacterized alkaline shock family protein YloU